MGTYLDRGKKIAFVLGILIAIFAIVFIYLAKKTVPDTARPIRWGVTFSQKFATEMGLDWKQAYDALFSDLNIRHIRLVAYWDLIEKENNQFSFEDLDYQFSKALAHGAAVILTIGQKVPRWPECHIPNWARTLARKERHDELLSYMETLVERYKDHPVLLYWQVENEPFFPFGECPETYPHLLDDELALERSLAEKHKIVLTDSGEFGLWYFAARKGEVFGTTMYRRVYNNLFGYIDYRLPPSFFRIKELLTRFLVREPKPFFVSELAAEPWLSKQLYETSAADHLRHFDLDFFKDTIRYAREAGFPTYYLWGAEWWYWLKKTQGHPEFWEYAKTIFSKKII